MKRIRHALYFDEKLSKRLEVLADKPGATMSNVVNDALRDYFERKGADALDDRFGERLDGIAKRLNLIERDQRVTLESLALYIRYQLMVSRPVPDAQAAALQALGNQRFQTFIEEVGRRIATGKGTIFDLAAKPKASQ
ncbi:MAG TPA: CopG family transcriptional regulator [Rhizomicrobium sp.]|nr:CopG family transcriptional regulator [Rhizomicrobium sp.]